MGVSDEARRMGGGGTHDHPPNVGNLQAVIAAAQGGGSASSPDIAATQPAPGNHQQPRWENTNHNILSTAPAIQQTYPPPRSPRGGSSRPQFNQYNAHRHSYQSSSGGYGNQHAAQYSPQPYLPSGAPQAPPRFPGLNQYAQQQALVPAMPPAPAYTPPAPAFNYSTPTTDNSPIFVGAGGGVSGLYGGTGGFGGGDNSPIMVDSAGNVSGLGGGYGAGAGLYGGGAVSGLGGGYGGYGGDNSPIVVGAGGAISGLGGGFGGGYGGYGGGDNTPIFVGGGGGGMDNSPIVLGGGGGMYGGGDNSPIYV
eukprot:TRINITY_DN68020_c1_g9_i1.p2 TRINITY_DN68020_c1_g9~~TRINITY_DN68020_c1_g9_i1.p2  ORF type:complete len:308 (-),score=70.30 TRINITY_DN68020_c1_g9_i1:1332-2255(-)